MSESLDLETKVTLLIRSYHKFEILFKGLSTLTLNRFESNCMTSGTF
jgi:hypothetical protein